MVVHSDRDDFLGFVLTNNVLIQEFLISLGFMSLKFGEKPASDLLFFSS
jgi:hypothetical protein